MKKTILDNGLILSLLAAVILGGFAFWRSTEKTLAVQETKIAVLEKQVDKLNGTMEELFKMMW